MMASSQGSGAAAQDSVAQAKAPAAQGEDSGGSLSVNVLQGSIPNTVTRAALEKFCPDASEYPLSSLQYLQKKKPHWFKRLDFGKVSRQTLDELFPRSNAVGCLRLPKEFRKSTAKIEEWCNMTRQQQQDYKDEALTRKATSGRRGKQQEYGSSNNTTILKGPPAPPLSQPIPYLEGRLSQTKLYYSQVPPDLSDWTSKTCLVTAFPIVKGFGDLHVPKCLLMDAKTDQDKLIVVNWWRFLSKQEQRQQYEELRNVYASPRIDNRLLPADYHERVASYKKAKRKHSEVAAKDPNNKDFYVRGPRRKKGEAPVVVKDMTCKGRRGEKYEDMFRKCYSEATKDITMEGGAKPLDSVFVPESLSHGKGVKDLVFVREGNDYVLRSVKCTKEREKNGKFCSYCQELCNTIGHVKKLCAKSQTEAAEKQQQMVKTLKSDLTKALRREKRLRVKLSEVKKAKRNNDESSEEEESSPKQRQQQQQVGSPTRRLHMAMQQQYNFEQQRDYWNRNN